MPQRFPMPASFSLPGPNSTAATQLTTGASDIHNNRYHGFQSMLTPEIAFSAGDSPTFMTTAIQTDRLRWG